ncbi:sensor histidine kinase [Bacillus solimangrovi]|uniref:Sensor histidine kinase n=1 Tax=Bacillus solimangrovi TaxID=1305675 RepID=A0A1E5LH09_9BACI|nr:sensor histidine kinase [Bacillus solimangrovi]OEH93368.1 two-component sensor histidine kinase [Bacillus solimangrovi]
MRIVLRQIMTSILFLLVMLMFCMVLFFTAFPLDDWSLLWERELLDVPFVLLLLVVGLTLGVLLGGMTGIYWRKQLQAITNSLKQLEQSRSIENSQIIQYPDLEEVQIHLNRLQKHLSEQTKLSQRLTTEKVENEEKRIQEVVLQERNRLARELHDSVSQQLFAASMMMSAINEMNMANPHPQAKQLKVVEEMIHQSQLEMRALLLHLRPVALKGKSIKEGIEELFIELMEKVSLQLNWNVEDLTLDKGMEDHLFRILQESVSNTLRHAKATSLEVLLVEREQLIIMRVVDDGVGFKVEEAKTGSYGLQNMYERALEIGGTLKVVSSENNGTRLEVQVPLIPTKDDDDD